MSVPPTRLRAIPVSTAGTLFAGAGAFAYGVTVVIGRRMAVAGVPSATALGVRFATAAVVLAALLRARRIRLVPEAQELVRLVLLGAIGYTTESTFFYLSLRRGTAAACALLFYAYPAIVCGIEWVRGHERPARVTLTAMFVSLAGTSLVAATGADVSISASGIGFALASAAVYAVYLLVGREFGRRSEPMRAAAWLAAGAATSSVARGAITGQLANPVARLAPLVAYGVFTAAAFWLTFAALRRIGSARTAVVMTLEAVTAAALGALFLGERLSAAQAGGGLAILAAAAVIGLRTADAVPPESRRPPVASLESSVAT